MFIDYGLIAESIAFYESRGYRRIESPWLVSRSIGDITKPAFASSFAVTKETKSAEKVFVASGEQSLLYLIGKGYLPESGKLLTVTPCMRDDAWDELHWKQFLKVELMEYGDGVENAAELVNDALEFFSKHVDASLLKETDVPKARALDIELDGVEVGSYGVRECSFVKWAYGTGLAEPRFSMAKRIAK